MDKPLLQIGNPVLSGLIHVLTAGGAVLHQRIAGRRRQHAALLMAVNVLFCMDNAVPNWQSCDYGKDICADDFRCCVASEDCLTTKKTTCQNQCTECAFKVDYKSTPDAIKVHSPAPDGTNKCLTLMAGNPPQLSLFTCDWKWYQIFKKFGTNQFQLSNTDLCLTQ
jgi:hypothetical protein